MAWSPVTEDAPSGTTANRVCHTGGCVAGSGVDAAYYAAGAGNPANPGQTCQQLMRKLVKALFPWLEERPWIHDCSSMFAACGSLPRQSMTGLAPTQTTSDSPTDVRGVGVRNMRERTRSSRARTAHASQPSQDKSSEGWTATIGAETELIAPFK